VVTFPDVCVASLSEVIVTLSLDLVALFTDALVTGAIPTSSVAMGMSGVEGILIVMLRDMIKNVLWRSVRPFTDLPQRLNKLSNHNRQILISSSFTPHHRIGYTEMHDTRMLTIECTRLQ
jgi:hypothetical protein